MARRKYIENPLYPTTSAKVGGMYPEPTVLRDEGRLFPNPGDGFLAGVKSADPKSTASGPGIYKGGARWDRWNMAKKDRERSFDATGQAIPGTPGAALPNRWMHDAVQEDSRGGARDVVGLRMLPGKGVAGGVNGPGYAFGTVTRPANNPADVIQSRLAETRSRALGNMPAAPIPVMDDNGSGQLTVPKLYVPPMFGSSADTAPVGVAMGSPQPPEPATPPVGVSPPATADLNAPPKPTFLTRRRAVMGARGNPDAVRAQGEIAKYEDYWAKARAAAEQGAMRKQKADLLSRLTSAAAGGAGVEFGAGDIEAMQGDETLQGVVGKLPEQIQKSQEAAAKRKFDAEQAGIKSKEEAAKARAEAENNAGKLGVDRGRLELDRAKAQADADEARRKGITFEQQQQDRRDDELADNLGIPYEPYVMEDAKDPKTGAIVQQIKLDKYGRPVMLPQGQITIYERSRRRAARAKARGGVWVQGQLTAPAPAVTTQKPGLSIGGVDLGMPQAPVAPRAPVTPPPVAPRPPVAPAPAAPQGVIPFNQYDADQNGKIDAAERARIDADYKRGKRLMDAVKNATPDELQVIREKYGSRLAEYEALVRAVEQSAKQKANTRVGVQP